MTKKQTCFTLLVASILISVSFIFGPRSVMGSMPGAPEEPGKALPDSIQKFVQRACMDCHADDGSAMARGKLNFTKWGSYDSEKQAKKANAMAKELSKGDMPPKKWRANNADDVPTPAETDMVVKWAKTFQK
jgi:hypothetical protein